MKFLGIDYGTKRIGLAISDERGVLAFPKEIIPAGSEAITQIGEIIKKENIEEVVVGESVNFHGEPNIVSAEIEKFISKLEESFNLSIHKQKEFLTSVEARKSQDDKSKKVDASAAALILQRYLDKRNKANIKDTP